MKAKEIIKLAAFYLQLDGVLSRAEMSDNYTGEIVSDGTADAADLERLLRCCNLVYSEIAAEVYPLEALQTVTAADGVIQNSVFSKRLIDVKRVEDANGNALKFKAYPSHIKTDSGKATVRYTYMPDNLGLCGVLDYGDKIGARIMAYGTAAEYCVISSMFDEALTWERRFRDALAGVVRKKSDIKVPPRRWK